MNSSNWVVKTSAFASPSVQTGPVMAWARDCITGVPVYIQELDKSRAGAKCGCECPSCELSLTAVNVGKAEFIIRPHFRHPNGAPSADCMFLAARLAAMQLLLLHGVFLLPRRQLSAQVLGLSGQPHEAWVELPPERVRIRDFDFRDKVAAILTLDDGRQLRVQLIGSGTAMDSEGRPIPTIVLNLPDAALASMSPEDLKDRLTLAPENICWVSHWNDVALKREADEKARLLADGFMDLENDDARVFEGVDPKFRRETLLHLEVKRILAESNQIQVPALHATAHGVTIKGKDVKRTWNRPTEMVPIFDVQLEQRFGRVIPDVIAKVSAEHDDVMMIEVTVTNQIDDERLARIRERTVPTLEIDLSMSVGLITRAELKKWVVDGLETKRWLHHPERELQRQTLTREVDAEIADIDLAENEAMAYRRNVLAAPIEKIANDYLQAVFAYAECFRDNPFSEELRLATRQAGDQVQAEAAKLAIHGYPEAVDSDLTGGRQGIIPRIQSIKTGHGIGYRLESTMAVMNAIRQSKLYNRSNHSIYLIAEKAYRKPEAGDPPGWFTYWVDEIKTCIGKKDVNYLRNGRFDRLLSLLFPELAPGLATGYGSTMAPTKKPVIQQIDPNDRFSAIQKIRALYEDGAYRHYAPQIMFDDVLREAEELQQHGESYFNLFEVWSDRYHLNCDLTPIFRLLKAAGYAEACNQWPDWTEHVSEKRAQGPVIQPAMVKPDNSMSPYLIAKGR